MAFTGHSMSNNVKQGSNRNSWGWHQLLRGGGTHNDPISAVRPRFFRDPGFSASDIRGSTPVLSKWGLGIY
jgi:hypothetical protein